MSVLAVDWSGRRTGERRFLWTAEAADGALLDLACGRTRAQLTDDLLARASASPGVVVGFDFSFSLPAWFLDERRFALGLTRGEKRQRAQVIVVEDLFEPLLRAALLARPERRIGQGAVEF